MQAKRLGHQESWCLPARQNVNHIESLVSQPSGNESPSDLNRYALKDPPLCNEAERRSRWCGG